MDKTSQAIRDYVENSWKGDTGVLETLKKYIEIPNQSPDYDSDIHTNGLQEKACDLLVDWVKAQKVDNLRMRVFKNASNDSNNSSNASNASNASNTEITDEKADGEQARTPLIFMELPASDANKYKHTVLMYGHFDKQPPLTAEWDDDLGPHKPVIKDGKLYGRGGADDGYSIFACIDCIKSLQLQKLDYPRIVVLIEGSEESGSKDLAYYREKLSKDIGQVDYVICLDSGCLNYEQMWLTSSLRGVVVGYLKVQLLKEGIHSGGSGLVRDSFHVVRELLDRIDNYSSNGGTMLKELHQEIPKSHVKFAEDCAKALGDSIVNKIPFVSQDCCTQLGDKTDPHTLRELLLNQWWRPQVTVTGIDGIPDLKGGNVLRKYTTLKLSVRIPPSMDLTEAQKALTEALTKKPLPFNAHVEADFIGHGGGGFVCPELKPWLQEGLESASKEYFGKTALFAGVGGSIPLMGQLLELFPTAQFIVTGILGPGSNAHGPNEFLHIDFTKKLTMCMATILNTIALKHGSK